MDQGAGFACARKNERLCDQGKSGCRECRCRLTTCRVQRMYQSRNGTGSLRPPCRRPDGSTSPGGRRPPVHVLHPSISVSQTVPAYSPFMASMLITEHPWLHRNMVPGEGLSDRQGGVCSVACEASQLPHIIPGHREGFPRVGGDLGFLLEVPTLPLSLFHDQSRSSKRPGEIPWPNRSRNDRNSSGSGAPITSSRATTSDSGRGTTVERSARRESSSSHLIQADV